MIIKISKSRGVLSGLAVLCMIVMTQGVVYGSLYYGELVSTTVANSPKMSTLITHPNAGTVSGLILEMGSGARGIALGGAQAGNYGDADMYYWNVGAMGMIEGMKTSFTHIEYLLGSRLEHLSVAYSIGRFGVIGMNADYMGYGTEKRTIEDNDGTFLKEDGTFTGRDIILGINYGYRIGDFGTGVGINYLRSDYDNVWANGVGINIGMLYVTPVEGLTAGMTIKNIGPQIRFQYEGYDQPLNGRIGVRYAGIMKGMVVVYGDVKIPAYQYPSLHVGVEVTPIEYITVRAGYKSEYGNTLGWYTGLSGGIGINIDEKILKAGRMTLDYAFVPYGDLGMTHRISIGFGMGSGKKDEEEVKIEKTEKKPEPSEADKVKTEENKSPKNDNSRTESKVTPEETKKEPQK